MNFCGKERLLEAFAGKRVALVGSGPSCLNNEPGFVDSHEVVTRVNNYKTSEGAGFRTDVYYSFFGGSIRKNAPELQADGVKLCICKCPNAQFMESEWHRQRGKMLGVDFRYIYERRKGWWFCDTYIPTVDEFMVGFELLGRHIPTTGFAALLAIVACEPASVYVTGFDFFSSKIHNVNERWRAGDPTDPIGHVPEQEKQWIMNNSKKHRITLQTQ